MSGLVVPNICVQIQKQLATLNNVRVLLKSVLTDLRARNFVHAKRCLRARCVHARHSARNLPSPENDVVFEESSTEANIKQIYNCRRSNDSDSLGPYTKILRSVMEQKENCVDVTDETQPFIREITFRSVRKPLVILFLNQTTKDMKRFCTRLASSKYFSPVTADDTYNIAGHYLVQTGYENLSVLRRANSKSPWFPGPCAFVRYLGEVDHCMLWQAANMSCATLADIRVLGIDDDKAIYNAILTLS